MNRPTTIRTLCTIFAMVTAMAACSATDTGRQDTPLARARMAVTLEPDAAPGPASIVDGIGTSPAAPAEEVNGIGTSPAGPASEANGIGASPASQNPSSEY
jgi:hypothetical protein